MHRNFSICKQELASKEKMGLTEEGFGDLIVRHHLMNKD